MLFLGNTLIAQNSAHCRRLNRYEAKRPPGAPMTLGNMRLLGVQRLVTTCLNDACRHQGLIDVSTYPDDTEVPSFASKVVCAKCGARVGHIDVRANWKEQPPRPSLTGKQWR
jgi:hypothetical protein